MSDKNGKWTPGPWKIRPRPYTNGWNGAQIWSTGGVHVASVTNKADKSISRKAADAHLIAASPDLYESLADTLALAELKYGGDNETALACFTQARAALCKARGEVAQ